MSEDKDSERERERACARVCKRCRIESGERERERGEMKLMRGNVGWGGIFCHRLVSCS